jgi:hypothetical protein
VAICRRCGTYMCSRCVDAAGSAHEQDPAASGEPVPQCQACRARAGGDGVALLRRDRIVWGELLGFSFELYKRHFAQVTLAVLVVLAPFVLGHAVSLPLSALFEDDFVLAIALSLLLWIAQMLAQAAATLSALDVCVRLARGEAEVRLSLRAGLSRLGPLLLQYLIVNFALMFAALLAAAPVIAVFALSDEPALPTLGMAALVAFCGAGFVAYTALGFSFASLELVAQPRLDAFDAIRNAWAIARGERLTIFVGLVLVGLLLLAGALFCLVGLLFTLGYAAVLFSVLYVALRNGAELTA